MLNGLCGGDEGFVHTIVLFAVVLGGQTDDTADMSMRERECVYLNVRN